MSSDFLNKCCVDKQSSNNKSFFWKNNAPTHKFCKYFYWVYHFIDKEPTVRNEENPVYSEADNKSSIQEDPSSMDKNSNCKSM